MARRPLAQATPPSSWRWSEDGNRPTISNLYRARFLEARLAQSWIKSKLYDQFVSEYETGSLPKRLQYKVENQTNGPGFYSFELTQHKSRWRTSLIPDQLLGRWGIWPRSQVVERRRTGMGVGRGGGWGVRRSLFVISGKGGRTMAVSIDTAEIRIWRHFRWLAFVAMAMQLGEVEINSHLECKLCFSCESIRLWTNALNLTVRNGVDYRVLRFLTLSLPSSRN